MRLLGLMNFLFDHVTPSGIGGSLTSHEVTEAIDCGWHRIFNGDRLKAAENGGFDLFLTTGKRIRYRQNLTSRRIALVVLGNLTWRVVRRYLDRVTLAVNAATPGRNGVLCLILNPAVGNAGAARMAQFLCAAQLIRTSPNG